MTNVLPRPRALALMLVLVAGAATPPLAQAATWAPTEADKRDPQKMAGYVAGDWTTPYGRLNVRQSSSSEADRYTGQLFFEGDPEPKYLFEDLRPDPYGALSGTWRRAGEAERRPARLSVSHYDGDVLVAGLEAWPDDGELSGTRGYSSMRDTMTGVRLLNGNWCTPAGMLRLRVTEHAASGAILSDDGSRIQYLFDLRPDSAELVGNFRSTHSGEEGAVTIASVRRGWGIVVTTDSVQGVQGHRILSGDLYSTTLAPPPDACVFRYSDPGDAQPQPLPPARSPQSTPAPIAGFKSLRKYDVRVDRVVAARDELRIDVFVTLKNATQSELYATSGVVMVRLEDSDGVGDVHGELRPPTLEGRTRLGGTPVIDPGRELRVKYSFRPASGARPSRVVITEGDRRAEFEASAGGA